MCDGREALCISPKFGLRKMSAVSEDDVVVVPLAADSALLPAAEESGTLLLPPAEDDAISTAPTEKKRQADARILIMHTIHAIAPRSDPPLPRALRPLTPTERLLRTSGMAYQAH